MKLIIRLTTAVLALPLTATADPAMECGDAGSQVEIAECVSKAETAVSDALELSLSFAMSSAAELDEITQRDVAVPALEQAQAAWSAYSDGHCEYVGTTFGGGSGTRIAITSCRMEIGRARVRELMKFVR